MRPDIASTPGADSAVITDIFNAEWLYTASTWVLPVLLAVTLHEVAHGYVAALCGDPTARMLGRLSLNPLRHVDRMGTVILPGLLLLFSAPFLFGWAKPVPVDFRRLRSPRRDMVLVAAAGPGSNLLMATAAAFGLAFLLGGRGVSTDFGQWVGLNLVNALQFNCLLAIFNMIPLPPLDGGRVAVGILPQALAVPLARMERFGMGVMIGVVMILPMIGSQLGMNLNILSWLIGPPVRALSGGLLSLVGLP